MKLILNKIISYAILFFIIVFLVRNCSTYNESYVDNGINENESYIDKQIEKTEIIKDYTEIEKRGIKEVIGTIKTNSINPNSFKELSSKVVTNNDTMVVTIEYRISGSDFGTDTLVRIDEWTYDISGYFNGKGEWLKPINHRKNYL
jgi:hypothetical protein